MSSSITSPNTAALHEAYEATLEQLANADESAAHAPEAKGNTSGSPDPTLAKSSAEDQEPDDSAPPKQTTSPADASSASLGDSASMPSLEPPGVPPLPLASSGSEEVMLDPSLFDIPPPPAVAARGTLPNMHQLDVSVQGEYSQPASSSSESPATPYAMSFGMTDKDSLSRPPSMGNLSAYGATKGTLTSVSSESGLDEVEQSESGGAAGGVPAPKGKKSHARKQPAGHIKRARNAFILFRKHITDSGLIPPSVESKHQNISVVAAKMWREAPQEVRHKFQEEARIEKEEHQRKYPGYRYQPVFRRTDIIRRRVRKDKTEDEKVEAVAEAMIKGKAGTALAEEVKEQVAASAAASESESEAAPKRRRRREDGELSKGAIRAQRAQNRAKAMRQNLLGSSLLNGMLYNQGYQHQGPPHPAARAAAPGMPQHPGQQYHLAQHPGEYAMPVGYDVDGRPMMRSGPYPPPHPGSYEQHPGAEMYRLPPIQDAVGWDSHDHAYVPPRMDHWPLDGTPDESLHHQQAGGYFDGVPGHYYPDYAAGSEVEYRFPPLIDGSTAPRTAMPPPEMPLGGPSVALPEAPSGHVMFNERLFDGALGSARRELDESLGAFDEAVAQANEAPGW